MPKLDAEHRAEELIDAGSDFYDRRARQLVRLRQRIGHSFAFWLCADYYATKQGDRIRLFHAPHSNSKPKLSRLVIETRQKGGMAYEILVGALEADVENRRNA